MRYLVLDTETTGLKVAEGHRIFEIACVEMVDRQLTNHNFHHLLNPQRAISKESTEVCKITDDMVAGKPLFHSIAEDFIHYLSTNQNGEEEKGVLLIHNAKFDMSFINNELELVGYPPLKNFSIIDTVKIAKIKYPSISASLDNLCKKFNIELTDRKKMGHNAILDCMLLAQVFLKMCEKDSDEDILSYNNQSIELFYGFNKRPEVLKPRVQAINQEEMEVHKRLVNLHKLTFVT